MIIGITAVSAQDSDNTDMSSDVSVASIDSSDNMQTSTTSSSVDSSSQAITHTSDTQSYSTTDSASSSSSTHPTTDKTSTTSNTQSTNTSTTQQSSTSSSQSSSTSTQTSDTSNSQVSNTSTAQKTSTTPSNNESSKAVETQELSNNKNLKCDDDLDDSVMTVSNRTVYYGESVQLVATVVNANTGDYVSGGNVGFKVNGVTVGYANLTDGKAYFDYDSTTLAIKDYTLSASYSGTATVNPTTSPNSTLSVVKHTTAVSVSDKTVEMGSNVQLVATVVDRVTDEYVTGGEVIFEVDGVSVGSSSVSEGKAYLDYDSSTLLPNDYTLSIIYGGTSTVESNTATGVLHVNKHDSVVSISNDTIMVGSNVELVVTVVDAVTGDYATNGTVCFKVNGKTVGYGDVSEGNAYFLYDASELSAKTYTLSATYGGNYLLDTSKTTSDGQLVVQKYETIITVDDCIAYGGNLVPLVATIKDSANVDVKNGTVAFKVNGKTVGYGDVVDGQARYIYDTTGLSAKTYTISASYGGGGMYDSSRTTIDGKLVVNKRATTLTISNASVYAGYEVQLVANVIDEGTGDYVNTGTVAFKVNGKTVGYGNVSDGKAYYTYDPTGLSAKNYTLSGSYGETGTYFGSKTTTDGILSVNKHSVSMTISNKTAYKNDNVQLVITVFDNTDDKYVSSGKVAFKINGTTVGYGNLSNGKAYYTYNTSILSAGTYTLSASYGGSGTLNDATASGSSLVISLRPVEMTISNKTVVPGTKNVQLVVTVVDQLTRKYVSGGTVLFKVGGVTVGNSTVVDGKAYLVYNFSAISGRNYTLNATYLGTTTYESTRTTTESYLKVEPITYSYDEIKDAAVYLRNHYEANDIITEVPIGSTTIGIEDFLPMMINMVKYIDEGNGDSRVEYIDYNAVTSQSDTITTTTFSMSDMISIGDNILNFYKENGRPPRYATANSQQIGYYNLVYSFAKIIDLSESTYLPSTCTVYPWSTIHPTSSKTRTIYLTSDVIINSSQDMAFMNSIKTELEKRGYTVIIGDYGPNSHNTNILDESMPVNAVQVSIFGGADAGVIYDVCTRSYMRAKSNRLVFFVYYPTATDITGLSWLPRAHDDNYSPSDFTGIAYPDQYLKEHGYDYVYSSNVTTIVNAIVKYIS